jgi:hypothetical protein
VDVGAAVAQVQDVPRAAEAAPRPGGARWLLAILLTAVNLPIVVATMRALARGWQPLGDDGLVVVRARDVGTSHHPLLGMLTSAASVGHVPLNHPGPLYFDALAPSVRILGPWVGLAVGVMVVNVGAASFAVVAARRIDGVDTMLAVAMALVGLELALGSELLFDAWPPNAMVLPYFAFLVAVTVLASGDLTMVPWVAGVGSLVLQTHLSYAVPVVAMASAGSALAALNLWRRREHPAWRRPAAWTAVVLVLAWIQPLVEQIGGPGEGNMSRIYDATQTSGVEVYGPRLASRLVAQVLTGPWFSRSGYAEGIPAVSKASGVPGVLSLGAAEAWVAAIVLVLVAVAIVAWRSGRGSLATMLAVAAVAVLAGIGALAAAPVSVLGVYANQMRWLWPMAALVAAALLAALLAALRAGPAGAGPAVAIGVAVVLAVSAASLPTYASTAPGPVVGARHLRQAQELVAQLGTLENRGPILMDQKGLLFAEVYSGLVYAELQDRGVPMVFDNEGILRQLGERRRDGGDARYRLREVQGPRAFGLPEGGERVAFVDGLSPAERAELQAIAGRRHAGETRPGDNTRATALQRKRAGGAVALYLLPIATS